VYLGVLLWLGLSCATRGFAGSSRSGSSTECRRPT
jgi:hypothetical protein